MDSRLHAFFAALWDVPSGLRNHCRRWREINSVAGDTFSSSQQALVCNLGPECLYFPCFTPKAEYFRQCHGGADHPQM